MLTQTDLKSIDQLLERRLEQKFEEKLSPVSKTIKKLEKFLIKTIKLFDREYISLRKRVEKVEDQLSRN